MVRAGFDGTVPSHPIPRNRTCDMPTICGNAVAFRRQTDDVGHGAFSR